MSNVVKGWPVFFAKRSLKARNLPGGGIEAGEPFPYQDVNVLWGLGAAFGVSDAYGKAPCDLDYVEVVDVQEYQMQRHIMQRGLTAKTVKKMLQEKAA